VRDVRCAVAAIGLVLVLSACGSSSPKGSATDTTAKATGPTLADELTCGATEDNCTPEQVVATVAYLYEEGGGATPAEAGCLAPITAKGKTAVNKAFDAPTAAETAEAIACVGSRERMKTIATKLAAYFAAHPYG
jgi:hypothetical protein